jgi:polyisoprenoid-binding protein YceI
LIRDPQGNNRVGFELTGKISRKDFGVSFGLGADSSKRLLGEEVKIQASVQLVEQVPELVAMA